MQFFLSCSFYFLVPSLTASACLRCVYALSGGVRRAHLLAPSKGAILKELKSRRDKKMLSNGVIKFMIKERLAIEVRV